MVSFYRKKAKLSFIFSLSAAGLGVVLSTAAFIMSMCIDDYIGDRFGSTYGGDFYTDMSGAVHDIVGGIADMLGAIRVVGIILSIIFFTLSIIAGAKAFQRYNADIMMCAWLEKNGVFGPQRPTAPMMAPRAMYPNMIYPQAGAPRMPVDPRYFQAGNIQQRGQNGYYR